MPLFATPAFDPMQPLLDASGPAAWVAWLLLVCTGAVWSIVVVKTRHLGRLFAAQERFERDSAGVRGGAELAQVVSRHPVALGSALVRAILAHPPAAARPALDQAVATHRRHVDEYLTTLASIGAAAPFVGLLGTVYGIVEAMLRLGEAGSATLAVVAPAVGEALIATALGLLAAIPAVVAYNYLARRCDALVQRSRTHAELVERLVYG